MRHKKAEIRFGKKNLDVRGIQKPRIPDVTVGVAHFYADLVSGHGKGPVTTGRVVKPPISP